MTIDQQTIATRVVPVRWVGDRKTGHLEMLDQRRLPAEEIWEPMTTGAQVADGIREMKVRGAPAIGISAAYGVFLGFREYDGTLDDEQLDVLFEVLRNTRPTAVNLFWALDRMAELLTNHADSDNDTRLAALFDKAGEIFSDDRENNLRMGLHGAELFDKDAKVLTHCNTGGLATGGYGTALGVIRALHATGKLAHVWIDETRPYLQGARLTAWECLKDEIPSTLITDSMAGYFMQQGQVDAVIVGTDRVTANGDVANKIGTYSLAVLCKHHDIPFYVAAPVSTLDFDTPTGDEIDIEQRSAREVTHVRERAIAPERVNVAHPAFDVTPAELVTAIITENGVARAPYGDSLRAVAEESG